MSREWTLPTSKWELLAQIQTEWADLMKVVAQLDGKQMVTPDEGGWTPKDNLAHISEWMKVMLGYHLNQRPSHEVIDMDPEVTADWDTERINQIFFERNRARTVKDISTELKEVYGRVMERLKSTPFEELLKPRYPEEAGSASLLEMGILNNTRDHFAEHRETIENALKKKTGS